MRWSCCQRSKWTALLFERWLTFPLFTQHEASSHFKRASNSSAAALLSEDAPNSCSLMMSNSALVFSTEASTDTGHALMGELRSMAKRCLRHCDNGF